MILQRGTPQGPSFGHDEDTQMDDGEEWNASSLVRNAGRQVAEWLSGKSPFVSQTQFNPYTLLINDNHGNRRGLGCNTFQPISTCGYANGMGYLNIPLIRSTARIPPIERIPIEILGEIFTHFVNDHSYSPFAQCYASFTPGSTPASRIAAHKHAGTSPLVLGRVCSGWRALSLSTSTLWSSISVVAPQMRHVSLFNLWLERSHAQPLQLEFHQGYDAKIRCDIAMHEILSLAAVHSNRWRTISLRLPIELQGSFSSLLLNPPNVLEAIELKLDGLPTDATQALLDSFQCSFRLQRAVFGTFLCDCNIPSFPWNSLSDIHLEELNSPDHLFGILSQCQRLEILRVDSIPYIMTTAHYSDLVLPHLRELRLGAVMPLTLILDRLTLPALCDLQLLKGFGVAPHNEGWISLLTLLDRSSCRIQSFTLKAWRIDEALLVQSLSSSFMSSITQLAIQSKITDYTIQSLSFDDNCVILPWLANISLEDCHTSDGVLTDMVCSRLAKSPGQSRLRHVRARFHGCDHSVDCSTLGSLGSWDCKVDISCLVHEYE